MYSTHVHTCTVKNMSYSYLYFCIYTLPCKSQKLLYIIYTLPCKSQNGGLIIAGPNLIELEISNRILAYGPYTLVIYPWLSSLPTGPTDTVLPPVSKGPLREALALA